MLRGSLGPHFVPSLRFPLLFPRSFCFTKNVVEEKLSKKRYAFVLSYLGANYQGVQLNKGINTLEGTLHETFYKLNWLTKDHFEEPEKVHWNRCSRTDKGVHALSNIVSCKIRLPVNLKEALAMVNKALPKDILVLDIAAVPKGFDARRYCGDRTYEYFLPVHALKPSEKHPDYPENQKEPWKFTEKDLDRFFVGTRKYHNFTKKVKYSEDKARRHIFSFSAELEQHEGMEFVRFVLVGQSFLYHQIRKMIGLICSVVRDGAPPETLAAVMKSDYGNWLIPLAPGEFLHLAEVNLERYNSRVREIGGNQKTFHMRNYYKEIQSFRQMQLYPYYNHVEKQGNLIEKFHAESSIHMDYDFFMKPFIEHKKRPPPAETLQLVNPLK